MTTLTDFLLQRMAEDEAVAKAAVDPSRPIVGAWQWVEAETDEPAMPDPDTGGDYLGSGPGIYVSLRTIGEAQTDYGNLPGFLIHSADEVSTEVAAHIARHNPARVLAECEAKRRIVNEWSALDASSLRDVQPFNGLLTNVLCHLALPYADHPDYREEWRP